MKSLKEIQDAHSEHEAWMDENEDSGSAEVGVELGWLQALAWVLE
jgi:hypothetical protein